MSQVLPNGSRSRLQTELSPWPTTALPHANGNGTHVHANGNGTLGEANGTGNGTLTHANGYRTAVETAVDGVAIVMPAYREEQNLAATVTDFLQVSESAGVPHCVVVVNDGSPDRTGEVAEQLAAEYPGRVLVVHHEVNRGYGAAVSTGVQAALDRVPYRWVFLTDSDGQFRAAQLPDFLAEAYRERADAVVGYRPTRADPLYRRANAFLWTTASRILLRIGIRDVDCAYKLIDRSSLEGIVLEGEAATISPELISKLRLRNARIIERPVDHFPRQYGEQTGAKLSVVIRSLIGLLALAVEIAGQRRPGRLLRRLLHPKDSILAVTTLAAAGASVASYAYFVHRGITLAYPDAVSHLLIAKRVIDSPTVGAAQLGAVWLPLPHLLSLPFIWVNAWYYSGFAGSIISMIAYVLAVRYAYLTASSLTGSRAGGVVAAVAFGANPNVLYLQSTPMTELLLIACVAAAVYYLTRWCRTGRYADLAATAATSLLASLARYEGWILCVAIAGIVAYVAWRRSGLADGSHLAAHAGERRLLSRLHAVQANLIFYACLGASGVAGWLLWNAVIFGDAFYFQTGPFAKPSLWVSHSEAAIGHWGVSVLTYFYAMTDNAGAPALALGAAGFTYYLVRTRFRIDTIAPLALAIFIPFYVYALYSGQRPIHVTQLTGSLYNVRFGLLMVYPVAIFMSFLVTAITNSSRTWLRRTVIVALTAGSMACAAFVLHGGISTLTEAKAFRAAPSEQANIGAALWLRSHYDGGKVLMESFGNETVTFGSRIPLDQIVYEGSFRKWEPALAYPAGYGIRWIYMRRTLGNRDEVFTRLHGTPLLNSYRLVYQDSARLIYEMGGAGRQSVHPGPHPRKVPGPSISHSLLRPISATSFDALGNDAGNENAATAKYAIDSNPGSSWNTDFYLGSPTFGNLKKGTGLILDMGKKIRLSQVVVQFGTGCCAHVVIDIGNDNNPAPSALSTFTPVQGSNAAVGRMSFNVTNNATGRYVLIWLSYLPPLADSANKYEAQIYNVIVRGSVVGRSG